MLKTKKLFFALLSTVTAVAIAQTTTSKGLFIGNSGNGPQTNASYLDFSSNTATLQENVAPSYVQFCLNENNFAYLAATDSIYKYDISTQELVESAEFIPTSTENLCISGDYLFAGNQFGADTAHLQVFNKTTLASVSLLGSINHPVSDMVAVNGKLYVLQNIKHTVETYPNYYVDSLGFISVINMTDLTLESEITFDATQAHNFKKVFAHNNKLTIFGTHEFGTTSHHVYTYDIDSEVKTYNTFDYSINLTYGNQSSQLNEKVYFKFNSGIGLYDLEGDSVLNSSVVSETPTSFAVDWNNESIYLAKGNYFSSAYGKVFNFDGDSIGEFTPGVGYAPEAMCIVSSNNPVAVEDYGRLKIYGEYNISSFGYITGQTPTATISITSNDQEVNSSNIISQGANGVATISSSGMLTYTPTDYTNGTISDEITYRISNVFNDFDTAKVTIDWIEINATMVNFDELDLGSNGYLKGEDGKGGFLSSEYSTPNRGAYFPTNYNSTYGSWSGFAPSNLTDNTTPGSVNQFSSFSGSASSGDNFVVANGQIVELEISSLYGIKSIDITNTTYAGLSMTTGDAFSKKFGGASGTDEDWFKVMIYGIDYNNDIVDSVEVYLADYRFTNSVQDFILNSWETIDFTSTGLYNTPIKSLRFNLSSSDNGTWGMNTPAYFCLDNIDATQFVSLNDLENNAFSVYPNPTSGVFILETELEERNTIHVYDLKGRKIYSVNSVSDKTIIDLSAYKNGLYVVQVLSSTSDYHFKIVKQ